MEQFCKKYYWFIKRIMNKSVNIFILNWNGKKVVHECLDSLMKISYLNSNVIVIDNGSKDDSINFISKEFPKVKIIELKHNYGFARGNNMGFNSIDKADYSIFINNDTIVDSDFVEPLINTLEADEKIAQVSPKIFYHHQKNKIWYAGATVNLLIGYIRHNGIRKKDSTIFCYPSITDYATGCCVCMRSNEFDEIGMFDESFPMYCEDVDLSLRFKKAGKKVFYVPDSKVWHKVSYSIGGEFSINKWKIKQLGKFKLISKHLNSLIVILIFPLLVLLSLIELVMNSLIRWFR